MQTRTIAALFVLFLIPACAGRETAAQNTPPPTNPFAWAHDGFFPAPSNMSLQNGRIVYDDAEWGEEVLAKAPTLVEVAKARIRARDGFSPNLPVIIAVPGHTAATEEGLLAAGSVTFTDIADGTTVPVEVEAHHLDDEGAITMLMIVPQLRLRDGRTYLVTASGVRDEDGRLVPPAPLAAKKWPGAHPAIVQTREAVAKWIPVAEQAALQQAFTYTIGTNHYHEFEKLRAQVDFLAEKRPAKFAHTGLKNHFWYTAALFPANSGNELLGSMNGWRFVDEDGAILPQPSPRRWKVLVSLPERCPAGGCPVVIFGHGLQAMKETMLQVAGPLNEKGIIVISADTLWHETFLEPMHVLNGMRHKFDIMTGLIYQHVSLQMQLVKLIQGDLAALDVLPAGAPDGLPDLDADRIGYIGQSLGGVAGVTFMAYEPAIDGAIFNVAGGGIYTLFAKSMLKQIMRVPILQIPGLGPIDGYKASAFVSMSNDFIDPLQSAGRLLDDPRPKLLQVGLDDGIIPNESSDLLARTWNLEYIGEPAPGKAVGMPLRKGDSLRNGYTMASYGISGFMHHLALNTEKQVEETVRFFEDVLKR